MTAEITSGQQSLLEVRLDRSDFRIDLRLEWHVKSLVLFGASGSGKTTLLRILLGLEASAQARTRLWGHWLEDPDIGLRLPVHQRRLGWVPQSATLFPDRSVEQNIRFGVGASVDPSWIQQAIDVLELGPLLDRGVNRLSGGERQRVALARAIAIQPHALLLDEPMASLDVALRARVLPYLLRIRDELDLPLVYITHDPDEAILLGDEIAVLDEGRLIAQGAPQETLWSQAVHSLGTQLGVENVFEVACVATEGTSTRVRTSGGLELETPWPLAKGESLTLGIRAEDILVSLDRPERISARNLCPGRVAQLDTQSDHLLVHIEVGGDVGHDMVRDVGGDVGGDASRPIGGDRLIAKLTEHAVRDLQLVEGSEVYLIIKSQALRRIR